MALFEGEGVGALSISSSMSASIFATLDRGVRKSAIGEPEAIEGEDGSILKKSAAFGTHHIYVTKHKDTEK